MHLIDAHTYSLKEVADETTEPYAILSHRWDEETGEISFQDMQKPKEAAILKGFAKIRNSCQQAIEDGLRYVWVDTCCINKESSAELTEAINSMYRWYGASAVCYAFLADVDARVQDEEKLDRQIASCEWLTRGWTLQELLAPSSVVFYNQRWELLGTKTYLSRILTQETRIDAAILAGEPLERRSISQRMSWASRRRTKRVEDEAYCLLGIFGVNMPMLYGEGKNAFLRLQEEIIKHSDDHSIFSWPITGSKQTGLLADTPQAFKNCQRVKPLVLRRGHSPYSMTNRGLSIKLMAAQWTTDTYFVPLDCIDEAREAPSGASDQNQLCMFLRRLKEDDQYIRVKYEGTTFLYASYTFLVANRVLKRIEINVRQRFNHLSLDDYRERVHGFRMATPEFLMHTSTGTSSFEISASSAYNKNDHIISMPPGNTVPSCHIDIQKQNNKIKLVKLGFDFDYNPVCFIATSSGLEKKVPTYARNGSLNTPTNPLVFWSEEDLAQSPGIRQRSPLDTSAWSRMENGMALPLELHSGLWALKGDRMNGLNVQLADFSRKEGFGIKIARAKFGELMVWDVHFVRPGPDKKPLFGSLFT